MHNAKIISQKASLQSLAILWESQGDITPNERDEIIYMVTTASFEHWRPLLYVIPRSLVEPRLMTVPIKNRGGFGEEYIISDLTRHEFDLIEL